MTRSPRGSRVFASGVAAFLSLASVATLSGQTSQHAFTRSDVERFADSAFARYVRESAMPSLAVVVVSGDTVLMAKGYGYERDTSKAVSPDSTLFHIASLSKLFVATAIMQLVDAGRLRLDDPVAQHLPNLRIPRRVTVRQLLTHTSGIDAPFMADVVDRDEQLVPLDEYFKRHPPRFGRPPNREIRYSNQGVALAALVIEHVAGESFDTYLERHILKPLGMSNSSIRQPPPAALHSRVATAGSGRVPNFLQVYPSGAIVSTAADMSRFLRLHLNDGRAGETTMLSLPSLGEMQRRQWSAHPQAPGVGLGFFESDMGGVRALFHTGARGHFSLLYLLPEQRVGIFVVHSMRQGGPFQSLRTNFARAFVQRYFAASDDADTQRSTRSAALRFAGVYRPILFSTTTVERAAALFTDTRVKPAADGAIDVAIPGGGSLHAVPRALGVYRVVAGEHAGVTVAFSDTPGEASTRMSLSGSTQDPVSFDRLRWYERGIFHAALLAGAFTFVATFWLASIVRIGWRMLQRRTPVLGLSDRMAWFAASAASVLVALAPIAGLILLLAGGGDSSQGPRRAAFVALTLLFVGSVMALVALPMSVIAWRRPCWSRGFRVYFTVFAASAALLFSLTLYYHLAPFWL